MAIAHDRKVLITGGASSFGLDIAHELITAGAHVAIVDKSEENLSIAARELGKNSLPIRADVRIQSDLIKAVELAISSDQRPWPDRCDFFRCREERIFSNSGVLRFKIWTHRFDGVLCRRTSPVSSNR